MNIEFSKIHEAYEFVSVGEQYAHDALLDTQTGDVLFQSDSEELNEFPEVIDPQRYIHIPTKAELHLGKPVVFSFAETHMPDALTQVHRMFDRAGAYSRFKNLLEQRCLLDQWYVYEERETERALREWCQVVGVTLRG